MFVQELLLCALASAPLRQLHVEQLIDIVLLFAVFRSEGKYPNGGAAEFWPMTRYYELAGKFPGLLMTGAPWKELRNKLQHDIVSPQAATSYLPKLNPIAKSASKIFPTGAADLDDFTTRTAFDMFAEAVLGKNRGILFPETADPRDREFAENSKKALSLAGNLIYSPKENMLKKLVRTPLWNEFSAAMDITMKRALEISREVADSIDKVEKNPSTSTEEVKTAAQEMAQAENLWDGVGVSDVSETDGYIRRLIKSGKLTAEEAALEVSNLLFAGVETTSNSMNWLIWSLANNPEKQDKLAHELKTVLKGGDYNRDEKLPYLRAFYREVHRMTPVTSGVTNRKLEAPIELMQYEIPAGVKITLNSNAIQNDPRIVEDNEKFLPERWLADQVEKRKGTHLEVLDHKLLATPFSFGPRMCLGGRLAEAELLSLLARLVQDWEISVAPDCPPINRAEKLFLKLSDSPKLLVKPRV